MPNGELTDPAVPNWSEYMLPDTWPDQINFSKPTEFWKFFSAVFSKKRGKVVASNELPKSVDIPKYVLQEFHNLPHGNYSNKITRGYTRGFDVSMLGCMHAARSSLAHWLSKQNAVLDVGCGGGQMAAAVKRAGVAEVWGLDASPYLLKHASKAFDDIQFVQGLAEQTGFADQRFDGLSVCFVLHEIPPFYASKALNEFNRILQTNGLLAIAEPSAIQYNLSWWQVFKAHGFKGLYFKKLAGSVFEPFVQAWHQQDITKLLAEHGFEVIENQQGMPVHLTLARKVRDL